MAIKIIVALDFPNKEDALRLINTIDPKQCALKVGLEMFTRFGGDFVRYLVEQQYKVFLDLKFHDIPNTVAQACKAAADLGVWMINVHASGGLKMMQAARDALMTCKQRPLLIGVTLLTSLDQSDVASLGITSSLEEQLSRLGKLVYQAGLDGVVCSAHEVSLIKSICGPSFLTVTPGIRLPNDNANDQLRIMTPQQAIKEGSDYLVIGRSITHAYNPQAVIQSIIHSLS